MLLRLILRICFNMGRIIKVVKSIYGKIDWEIIRQQLLRILKKTVIIKENNMLVKFDKRFIKEYTASLYTQRSNKKIKSIKANIAIKIIDLIENSGHIVREENLKSKHKRDAYFGWEKYKCRFKYESKNELGIVMIEYFSCCVVIRCPNINEKYIYDIVDIKKETNQSQ